MEQLQLFFKLENTPIKRAELAAAAGKENCQFAIVKSVAVTWEVFKTF